MKTARDPAFFELLATDYTTLLCPYAKSMSMNRHLLFKIVPHLEMR